MRVDDHWCAKTYFSVLSKSGLPRGSVLVHAASGLPSLNKSNVRIDAHMISSCAADTNSIQNLLTISTHRVLDGVCVYPGWEELHAGRKRPGQGFKRTAELGKQPPKKPEKGWLWFEKQEVQ